MSTSILTVSQINTYVKMLIDGDSNLKNIFISGEISNFNNNYKSGHFYFSLKDDKAIIKAVMFSGNASRVRFRPTDGMKVIVSGRISVYEATGQYQLYVDSMQPDGVGVLAIAYEQMKAKLSEEGLFDASHKLDIPEFPKRIGVITSPTGAVIQDIKNVISRRCPIVEIILCPVAVQGEFAPQQLVKAVELFNRLNNVDLIIIGRGGGSFEDLNCFNDEKLVRAIYASNIPTISAVGHETDFTLCDFVSDLRAPTPSAAAEIAVPDRSKLIQNVKDIYGFIEGTVENKLFSEMQNIDRLNDAMNNLRFENYIVNERTGVSALYKKLNSLIGSRIKLEKAEVTAAANKVNVLNPISLLQKGYSAVIKDNSVISSVKFLKPNDKITVKMSDGEINCSVESIK